MTKVSNSDIIEKPTVIVGAGPSGLTVAAGLKKQGVHFIVLERANSMASLSKTRTYCRLKRPLSEHSCESPFSDDCLESYAKKFDIQPQFNESIQSAVYDESCGHWRIKTAFVGDNCTNKREVEYICQRIVVTTIENAEKVVPKFLGCHEIEVDIIHACEYKSDVAYRGEKVMVVGCGNSKMEVYHDLCNHDVQSLLSVRCSSNNIVAATSSSRVAERREGSANTEVTFDFEIRGQNSSVEIGNWQPRSFKVQLFGPGDMFLGLIRSKSYSNSCIEKEGNNEVMIKSNVQVSSNINPEFAADNLIGMIEGPGVVFLTKESSIIISKDTAKSPNLASEYEAIGRIVSDNGGIMGSAIHCILEALRQSKSVVVTKVSITQKGP